MKIFFDIVLAEVDKDDLAFLEAYLKEIMGFSSVESVYIHVNGKEVTIKEMTLCED